MSNKKNLNILIVALIFVVVGIIGTVYTVSRKNAVPAAIVQASPTSSVSTPSAVTTQVSTDSTPSAVTTQDTSQEIEVYITGEVNSPNIYAMLSTDRIADAIEQADGVTDEANLEVINLAEHLTDGEHVIIPKIGEPVPTPDANAVILPNLTFSAETNAAWGVTPAPLVNINTANLEELKTLPGVGDVTAGNIIAYREANGNFETIDEIQNVTRIGPKTFERLKDLICV